MCTAIEDPQESAGGQPRRDKCNRGDQQHDGEKRERIRRADAEEQAVQQTRRGEGAGNPHNETDRDQGHGLPDDKTEDG